MSTLFRQNGFRLVWAAWRPGLCFLVTTLVFLAPAMAGPVTVTIGASADAVLEDSKGNGAFDVINPLSIASNGLYVRNYLGGTTPPHFEDRAVVLFSLAGLSAHDLISSLVLNLDETSNANSVGGIAIEGYASDGTITLADATAAGATLGTFDATVGAGSHSIALDPSFVQSLVNSGAAYLGVRLQGTERTVVTLFDSIESSKPSGPALGLTYTIVPEPSSIALLACGLSVGCLVARYRARRRTV